MKEMTGLQEMRFLAQTGDDAARLAALARELGVLPPDTDPDADPVLADWEACLLELHRAISGPRIHAELTCPECGETAALIFGVDDLPRDPAPTQPAVSLRPLRPLRLSDLIAVEAADSAARPCLLLALAAGIDLAEARGLLTDPATEGAAMAALEQALLGLDLRLATSCTECAAEIVQPFDVQGFVMADRNAAARRLLDEIHQIARVYHWSEMQILSLPRARRLAYLDRIDRDALQIEVQDARF